MENRSAQCFFLLLCPWYVWKENERKGRKIGGEESSFLTRNFYSRSSFWIYSFTFLLRNAGLIIVTRNWKRRDIVEIRNRIRNFQIQIIFQSYFLVHKTSIKIRQRFWRNRTMTFSSKQKINGKRQRRRFETGDEEGGSNKIFKWNVFFLVPREILNIKKMCSMSLHFIIAFTFDLEKKF